MKANKHEIWKKLPILGLVFLLVISGISSPVYANSDSSTDQLLENETSKYIGTIFYDDVAVLTAGGGYRFYTNAVCTNATIAVGGSHELTDEGYSVYLKADDGYAIEDVNLQYRDGSACGDFVTQTNDIYCINIPADTELSDDLEILVDVRFTSADPLSVNFALLEWKSKGESGTLSFNLNGKNYTVHDTATYDAAYTDVFALLVDQAEEYTNISVQTEIPAGQTKIWKVSGTACVLYGNLIIREGAKVVFLCEDNATLKVSNTGKITLAGGIVSAQGKDKNTALTFDGEKVLRFDSSGRRNHDTAIVNGTVENLFQLRYGDAYFEYASIINVYSRNNTSVSGGAVCVLPWKTNTIQNLYISDMTFKDCQGICGPALSNDYSNEGSEFYIFNSLFTGCIANGGINNSGGGAVQGGGGKGLYTFQSCTFVDNESKYSGTSWKTGYDGGGAVRWYLGGGGSLTTGTFNGCTFSDNISLSRGGAIMAAGSMQLAACTLFDNTATRSGGAVFVAPHSQATPTQNPASVKSSVAFNPGNKIFNNKVTGPSSGTDIPSRSGLGGAIHFMVMQSVEGSISNEQNVRKEYDLVAYIKGTEIYDNEAADGGAVAVSVSFSYDSLPASLQNLDYNCGVYVDKGSSIHGNKAAQYGGAVYIESDKDYTNNKGFFLEDGKVYANTSQKDGGAVYLQRGRVTVTGGSMSNNSASRNGGAAYLGGGEMNVSGGSLFQNTAENGAGAYLGGGELTISGGAVEANTALHDGGGAYLGGGTLTVSGGTISANKAQNGAGALVANGNVIVEGGTITQNKATQNGGGIAVTNGNFTMTGGQITANTTVLDGGGIYVSSTEKNAEIIIRSGEITDNHAGNSGGALGVRGQDGVSFTITIGSNTVHTIGDDYHRYGDIDEDCPVIERNTSVTSGGGIYLSGSYSAEMNIYCLIENDNKVGSGDTLGISASNFMKVEGGTLLISTKSGDTHGCGNVVINSSVHVTGGRVTLEGKGENPMFNKPITVDVDETKGSYFKDNREKDSSQIVSVQYFENFETNGKKSGQYISIDVKKGEPHKVQAALYSHTGFVIDGWTLMKAEDGKHVVATDPPTVYTADTDIKKIDTDIILYAKWVVVGYTVVFDSGTDTYQGTMTSQDFEYTEEKALTLNAYIRVGYTFVQWVDKATLDKETKTVYSDGATVSKLTNEHGAKITLVAQWKKCEHQNMKDYTLSSTENSISRQCPCLGYTEVANLNGITVTYDTYTHDIQPTYARESLNDIYPSEVWNLAVTYTGENWDGIAFTDDDLVPLNAGTYTATVSYNSATVSASVIINKADQTPPGAPDYSITASNDKNLIQILNPNDGSGKILQYSLWWYEGTQLNHTNQWTDWSNSGVSWELDKDFTNYYVEVRYKGDDNHNPSQSVKGIKLFFHSGKVIVKVSGEIGLDVTLTNSDESGLKVEFNPQDGYYIYQITNQVPIFSDGEDHDITIAIDQANGIGNINDIPSNIGTVKNPITITVKFDGAKKTTTVKADTVKDQVFTNIGNSGLADVTISRDSAYTAFFRVDNYAEYVDPAIRFSQVLPVGTTIIMKDWADASYWSYTVNVSKDTVALTDFVHMGSLGAYNIVGRDTFTLQFVVDFSRCVTGHLPVDTTLIAQFTATPVHPSVDLQTVPILPSEGSAVSAITLVDIPAFHISKTESSGELTQTIEFQYAALDRYGVNGDAVGISKWQNLSGVLLIVPQEGTILPTDARLEVKIGDSTANYALINGRFIVSLPSVGSGTAEMILRSEMLPKSGTEFEFTVTLGMSQTLVGSTLATTIKDVEKITLTYQVSSTIDVPIHAEVIGSLPEYGSDGNISNLEFSVKAGVLPANYTVRAVLYGKNKNDYTSTTQTMTINVSDGQFRGSLGLGSLKDRMDSQVGSLSLMLRIEVVDTNGKVVNYVPLYFILVDTRETK